MSVVAAVQMASGPQLDANLLEAGRLIRLAVEQGAGMVVLPENFALMGEDDSAAVVLAEEPGDGPVQRWLAEQAKRFGIWLVGGTVPVREPGHDKARSRCHVFDELGECRGFYDKIHLFDVQVPGSEERYEESAAYEFGERLAVIDTPFGRLGLAICYDLRFPELFRAMSEQGAQWFAVPSAFTASTGRAHWDVLTRARAIENLAYVVAAAQGGFHVSGRETWGNSVIVEPWGSAVATQISASGVALASLDMERVESLRRGFPALEHRRWSCRQPG